MKETERKRIIKLILRYPKWSNKQIAEKLKVNRSKVWRIRSEPNKFKKKTKSKQIAPFSTAGFEGIAEKIVDPKTKTVKIKLSHSGGPIFGGNKLKIHSSNMGENPEYDDEVTQNWSPYMKQTVVDEKTGKPLAAAEIKNRMKYTEWVPNYFKNPLQDLDYIAYEAMARSTFGGPLIQAIVKFVIGTGFEPQLELINPEEDTIKNQELIDKNQDIIHNLIAIDAQITKDDNNYLDVSFEDKIATLIGVTFNFNRSALIYGYDEDNPVEINGKKYYEIPNYLKPAHARDMGIIEVDPRSHRLKSFQWRNAVNMIDVAESIYLFNPLISGRTRDAGFYGDSMFTPMIDALRTIRKNIGVNLPAMAETAYAGLGFLFIKPQGSTESQKDQEYGQIASKLAAATTNIILEDPKDARLDNLNFDAKFKEITDVNESLLRYCVATTGLPQSMFFDESTSNRATMIGKIQLATATVIQPMREWISRAITDQWYDRWFKLLYKDKPEILKKFKVRMIFNDLNIYEWFDLIESLNELDSRQQLTTKAFGEKLKLDNYAGMVETDAEINPGGNSNSMSFGDGEGNDIKIKKTKSDGIGKSK